MTMRGGPVIGTMLAFLCFFLIAGMEMTEAQSGPVINVSWSTTGSGGGALNVNVSGLPSGAGVEVEVKDVSHGNQVEQPVGSPPAQADDKGNWPGAKAGSRVGYPGTATDAGGTKYVITVKVNGKTGPAKEVLKPKPRRSFWSVLGTLGVILLTDAVGATGQLELPLPPGRWGGAVLV
jgi:hypothetical protein